MSPSPSAAVGRLGDPQITIWHVKVTCLHVGQLIQK
jgi:hypothetical protein